MAYEPHLLPLLPGGEPIGLRGTQVTHLIEEIDWVATVVDDPALRKVALDLRPVLSAARRGDGLWIEGN